MRTNRKLASILLATTLAVPATAALAGPVTQASAATVCTSVVFVGVRGSGQPQGLGSTVQSTFDVFKSSVPPATTVGIYALEYPAAAVPLLSPGASMTAFKASITSGSTRLANYLATQERRCPRQKLVLSGYSQGAMIITNTLPTLPASTTSRISAIALFGDPSLVGGFTGGVGNYNRSHNGVARTFIRVSSTATYVPASVAAGTRSYCLARDPTCDYSTINAASCFWFDDICAHQLYVSKGYTRAGGTFLASRMR